MHLAPLIGIKKKKKVEYPVILRLVVLEKKILGTVDRKHETFSNSWEIETSFAVYNTILV